MVGIAGVIYPELFAVGQAITPMLRVMRHRGRDPQDSYGYHQLQLGCCGSSLYFSERHDLCIAIDGELQNRSELQGILKQQGYRFNDFSDAETIAYAYAHWGESCFKELKGYYSILLFDQQKELLYLIRDRLGKHSLYWSQLNQHILFASEMKALLATGLVPQVPDRQALGTYSLMGYIPQDVTAIQHINRLLPGHYLRASLDGACSVHAYWSAHDCMRAGDGDWSATFNHSLVNTLDRLDLKQERVGCVVGNGPAGDLMARELLNRCGELSRYQLSFAGQAKVDPHALRLDSRELLRDLVKIVWHMEDPLADIYSIGTWKICERAKNEGVTQVFDGSGFDDFFRPLSPERFGPRRLRWIPTLLNLPTLVLSDILLPFLEATHPRFAQRVTRHRYANPTTVARLRSQRLLSEKLLRQLMPKLKRFIDWDLIAQKFFYEQAFPDCDAQAIYDKVRSRLPDNQLHQWRQATAVHQVHWQTPCLSPEMLQCLHQSPLLMEARSRAFHPFNYPWAREPEFRRALRLASMGSLAGQGILNSKGVIQCIKKARKQASLSYPLWGLLILEIWNRLFVHNPMPLQAPEVSVEEFLSSNF